MGLFDKIFKDKKEESISKESFSDDNAKVMNIEVNEPKEVADEPDNRSQETQVREHLLIQGQIDVFEAFDKYRITRLSAYIFKLRDKGYKIETVQKAGKGNTVIYKLIQE